MSSPFHLFCKDADLQKVPEPFTETEASLAVVIDEYDPLRPNEYELVKQKFREEKENERGDRGERSERTDNRERSRSDRDYDRGERLGSTSTSNVSQWNEVKMISN